MLIRNSDKPGSKREAGSTVHPISMPCVNPFKPILESVRSSAINDSVIVISGKRSPQPKGGLDG